jgi:hypothetical protein
MRRTLLFCAVALMVCVSLWASDKNVTGKWNCVSDDGHGAVLHWVLTIRESEGRLEGELAGDMDPLPLIEPRFDGTVLQFKTFVNPNCTVAYHLTVTGDTMQGTFACPEASGTIKGSRARKR